MFVFKNLWVRLLTISCTKFKEIICAFSEVQKEIHEIIWFAWVSISLLKYLLLTINFLFN